MRSWIIFDFDDTLGGVLINGQVSFTHQAYTDAIRRFGEAMALRGHDPDEAIQEMDRIDREMCERLGFGDRTRFARSMERAYYNLCVRKSWAVVPEIAKQMFDIGMSVFTDYPYVPLPGALEVMDAFRRDYLIAVVTKGNQQEQMKKIEVTGVGERADRVIVCDHKDDEDWQYVVSMLAITREEAARSWAVGNSIKADVNPPLRLGFNAIHIHNPTGWDFENDTYETPQEGRRLEVVTSIREVLNFIPNSVTTEGW